MDTRYHIHIVGTFPEFFHSNNFPIDCGNGWYQLIFKLCRQIKKYLRKHPEIAKDFQVVQIKQKFGGLRFYVSASSEIISRYIHLAMHKSYNICESCGHSPAKEYGKCWIVTLCKKCGKQYIDKGTIKNYKNIPHIT
jgi:hypothetical protein